MKKFEFLGKRLPKDQLKKIKGGDETVGGGGAGSCTVDCTGCPAYTCSSNCSSMENGVSVTCDGVTKTCKAYPTCWS